MRWAEETIHPYAFSEHYWGHMRRRISAASRIRTFLDRADETSDPQYSRGLAGVEIEDHETDNEYLLLCVLLIGVRTAVSMFAAVMPRARFQSRPVGGDRRAARHAAGPGARHKTARRNGRGSAGGRRRAGARVALGRRSRG